MYDIINAIDKGKSTRDYEEGKKRELCCVRNVVQRWKKDIPQM